MLTQVLSIITLWIMHLISALGYGGIIFLMFLHSSIFVVPSEVVMPFSGFLISTGRFGFLPVVVAGTFGNAVGASFLYWLSSKGGRKVIIRYEHIFLVSQSDLQKVENFFNRFGIWAIVIGRCMPIVAGLISIPAGLAKVKYWKFLFLTCLGALIWNTFLTFIGYKLGQNWLLVRDRLHNFDLLIVGIIFLGVVWWIRRHMKRQIHT